MPHGQRWARIGLRQCLERLREHPAWKDRQSRRPHEGVGVAIGALMVTLQSASALCRLESDGTVTAVVGSVDISGSNTALRQIAAEAFGLPIERVAISNADSTGAPHSPMSGGSKITLVVGAAIVEACQDARKQAFAIAADQLEADLDDLELVDGQVQVRGAPERSIGLDRVHALTAMMYAQYPPVLGRGNIALKVRASAMAAHLARVRVDPDTHRPDVLEYVAVHDVGRAINPAMVEENIHGGVAQGIGWALYEQMLYDEAGRLRHRQPARLHPAGLAPGPADRVGHPGDPVAVRAVRAARRRRAAGDPGRGGHRERHQRRHRPPPDRDPDHGGGDPPCRDGRLRFELR